ncbi:MAG: HesA/MoeB/ThiF family protein [Paracoccaceae bacterium]
MILLVLLALLLVLVMALGVPGRIIVLVLALIWTAVVGALIFLPVDLPLVQALGGDWRPWVALMGVALVALFYRRLLQGLRQRAVPLSKGDDASGSAFSAAELDRYARHIVLREVGGPGQKRLKAARVLVIGAGGLGSPALLYLAAAGVGTIGVIDDDLVSNANLQRQIIHTDAGIGQPKVASARAAMLALNPFVTVKTYLARLDTSMAEGLFADYDLILDGSDNFATRYLVNEAAVALGKPLISGAISQWEGQIGLFHAAGGGPCYACLFPQSPAEGLAPSCAEAGVVGPLPGVVGSMMALEAIKFLTGAGATLAGKLMIYDGLWGESRTVATARRAGCACCGERIE